MLELDNFVYTYPDIADDDFQERLNSKVELKLLKLPRKITSPKRGQGFKHQKILAILMTHYDKMFIMWKAGVGKTCGFIGVCEKLRKTGKFKRAYIMTKGSILLNEIKQQIVCSCTDGYHEREARKDINLITAVNAKIGEFYDIKTYNSFFSILKNKSIRELESTFSDCIFIIDEVQNLRTAKSETIDTSEKFVEKTKWNKQFNRVFKYAKRTKIILSSATPIINFGHEIVNVMNFILPEDEKLPLNVKEFEKLGSDALISAFKGRVSYVREADTGVDIRYVKKRGEYTKEISLFEITMSKFQSEVYNNIKTAGIIPEQSQASNFVFPDGSFGEAGYKKYFPDGMASEELITSIKDAGTLKKMSIKYLSALLTVLKSKGNCWVFNEFVGPGVMLFAECLKQYKFEQYIGRPSRKLAGETYCESSSSMSTSTEALAPALRYAILTSDNKSKHIDILKLFRSYANRHGKYLKVLIGSPLTEAGISLANVRDILILSPRWNFSSTYQTISRAIRSTSHIDLIREIKEQSHGKITRIDINVTLYAAKSLGSGNSSADMQKYETSLKKEKKIRNITRLLKKSAIDCSLTRERNIRPSDVDGTEECDFDICDYKCSNDGDTESVDYSSFLALHSGEFLDTIKKFILTVLKKHGSVTKDMIMNFEQMKDVKDKNKPEILDLAVGSLLSNEEVFRDKYGNRAFVNERGGVLFFTRTPNYEGVIDDYYTKVKVATRNDDISVIVERMKELEGDRIISSGGYEAVVNSDISVKIKLYEKILAGGESDMDAEVVDYLREKYSHLVTTIAYPTELVKLVEESYTKLKKGRPAKTGSKAKLDKILKDSDIEEVMKGSGTIIHRLASAKPTDTSHATASFTASDSDGMRIFTNGEWRDVISKTEQPIFAKIFKTLDFNVRVKINDNPVAQKIGMYGTESATDGLFRIVMTVDDYAGRKSNKRNRGRECMNLRDAYINELLAGLYLYAWNIRAKIYSDRNRKFRNYIIELKEGMPESLDILKITPRRDLIYSFETVGESEITEALRKFKKFAKCKNIETNLKALGLVIKAN